MKDLARRDLTCNAIAFHPFQKQIIDPHGGVSDINAKILRMVGNPHERLEEDGLRALRIFRFVSQLGFEVDSETLLAIPDHFTTFAKVAVERIQNELDRLISAPYWKRALVILEKSGLFYEIFPEFKDPKMRMELKKVLKDRISLTFNILETIPSDSPIRLRYAVLLHQLSSIAQKTSSLFPKCNKVFMSRFLRGLRFPNKTASEILHLLMIHTTPFSMDLTGVSSDIEYKIRRLLYLVRSEYLRDYLLFNKAKDITTKGSSSITKKVFSDIEKLAVNNPPIELPDLVLNGDDVTKQLSLDKTDASQRELIGQILHLLRERVEFQPKQNTLENLSEILQNIRPLVTRCQRKDLQKVRIVATDHIRKIYTNNTPRYLSWENRHTYQLSRWLSLCLLRKNRQTIVIFDGTNLDMQPHQNHRKSLAKQFQKYRPFFINLRATREQVEMNFKSRNLVKNAILSSDADLEVFKRFEERMEKYPDCLAIPDRYNGVTINTYDQKSQGEIEAIVNAIMAEKYRMIILGGNVLTGKSYTAVVLKKTLESKR
jgi:tRNA nucleotidyltransferase (CCA-adding enzyme)